MFKKGQIVRLIDPSSIKMIRLKNELFIVEDYYPEGDNKNSLVGGEIIVRYLKNNKIIGDYQSFDGREYVAAHRFKSL